MHRADKKKKENHEDEEEEQRRCSSLEGCIASVDRETQTVFFSLFLSCPSIKTSGFYCRRRFLPLTCTALLLFKDHFSRPTLS